MTKIDERKSVSEDKTKKNREKKKKRRKTIDYSDKTDESVSSIVNTYQKKKLVSSNVNSTSGFDLKKLLSDVYYNPPGYLDITEDKFSMLFLNGLERYLLDDLVAVLLQDEGINIHEKYLQGPPKWCYSKNNHFDSFDYYVASGCPNCGSPYELDFLYSVNIENPALICLQCGHSPCPRDNDDLLDNLPTSKIYKNSASQKEIAHVMNNQPKDKSYVYIRGTREQINFGQKDKEWWQSFYMDKSIRMNAVSRMLNVMNEMSNLKASKARSIDEGITIMYECTSCHHRVTFNN